MELSKTILYSDDKSSIEEVKKVSAYIFREILIILHPFIPFVTEEIWLNNNLDKDSSDYLMFANWSDEKPQESNEYNDVSNIIEIITSIRSFKNEIGVSPGSLIDISLANTNSKTQDFFNKNEIVLKKLGRISNILSEDQKKSSASLIIKGELYKMYFEQDVDIKTIKDR